MGTRTFQATATSNGHHHPMIEGPSASSANTCFLHPHEKRISDRSCIVQPRQNCASVAETSLLAANVIPLKSWPSIWCTVVPGIAPQLPTSAASFPPSLCTAYPTAWTRGVTSVCIAMSLKASEWRSCMKLTDILRALEGPASTHVRQGHP